ncbi:MAG: LptA/OstA family protein [Pseudomonadota bacterium]
MTSRQVQISPQLSSLFIAAALFCTVIGAQAKAQNSFSLQEDSPINISAERCEVLQTEDKITCTGTVRVSQDDALLTADKMIVFGATDGEGFDLIEGEGNVRYARGADALSGDHAIYDAVKTLMTVTGNVVAVQEKQIMVGGKLIYNTETGALDLGPGEDGRVRGLFHTASSAAN